MRVAVMGAGGMGGFFGGMLARAGEDVTFVARGPSLRALRSRGLTVRSQVSGEFALLVDATDDPGEIGSVDLVLFCVKAYDLDAAAQQVQPLLGPTTMILPVQNGVDHVERLGRIVGAERVLGGVSYVSATATAPGLIVHNGGAPVWLGEWAGGTSARTESLRRALRAAGIPAELCADVRVALWEKFAVVCATSGLTALTRLPIGPLLACPESRALLRGLMEEVAAVAPRHGVDLAADSVGRLFGIVTGFEPSGRASLYHDLAAGRPLELESLNGTVARLGRRHGVPTPLNFAVYAALKPYVGGAPPLT